MKVVIFSLFILSLFFFGCSQRNAEKDVCFKKVCVKAEIADSAQKRAKGLMLRPYLAKGKGMLFVFGEETIPSFWMKNMRFPLDIIWINRYRDIVDISASALPCKDSCAGIVPKQKVSYALEVNAGFASGNHIAVGEKAIF